MPPPPDDVVVDAWLKTGGCAPERVEPVGSRKKKKSVLFRLVGAGDGGRPVVAKLCRGRHRRTEQRVYEHVLPQLQIRLPRYHGSLETPDGIWLFMEDGGATRCDPEVPAHRELAAHWLASLHGAAMGQLETELPDRGPAHHLELLQSGRRTIIDNLGNPAFAAEHLEVLDSLLGVCDLLEARWNQIEEASAALPRTLVHGDFSPKNLHIRSGSDALQFFPMDWEMAGWGIPACDLYPRWRDPKLPICDTVVYSAEVRDYWPGFDVSLMRRCVALGRVFRNLCGVEWASVDLRNQWPETPIPSLRIHCNELAAALQEAAWTD